MKTIHHKNFFLRSRTILYAIFYFDLRCSFSISCPDPSQNAYCCLLCVTPLNFATFLLPQKYMCFVQEKNGMWMLLPSPGGQDSHDGVCHVCNNKFSGFHTFKCSTGHMLHYTIPDISLGPGATCSSIRSSAVEGRV